MLVFHGRWSNHVDSMFNANRFHFLSIDVFNGMGIEWGCRDMD